MKYFSSVKSRLKYKRNFPFLLDPNFVIFPTVIHGNDLRCIVYFTLLISMVAKKLTIYISRNQNSYTEHHFLILSVYIANLKSIIPNVTSHLIILNELLNCRQTIVIR